jgi:hypothetical protein
MSIPSITSINSITTENRREIVQQSLAIARESKSVYTAIYAESALARCFPCRCDARDRTNALTYRWLACFR